MLTVRNSIQKPCSDAPLEIYIKRTFEVSTTPQVTDKDTSIVAIAASGDKRYLSLPPRLHEHPYILIRLSKVTVRMASDKLNKEYRNASKIANIERLDDRS